MTAAQYKSHPGQSPQTAAAKALIRSAQQRKVELQERMAELLKAIQVQVAGADTEILILETFPDVSMFLIKNTHLRQAFQFFCMTKDLHSTKFDGQPNIGQLKDILLPSLFGSGTLSEKAMSPKTTLSQEDRCGSAVSPSDAAGSKPGPGPSAGLKRKSGLEEVASPSGSTEAPKKKKAVTTVADIVDTAAVVKPEPESDSGEKKKKKSKTQEEDA